MKGSKVKDAKGVLGSPTGGELNRDGILPFRPADRKKCPRRTNG